MLDDATLKNLREAMDGLEETPWAALPALARIDAKGHRITIDRTSSHDLGVPVVIVHAKMRAPAQLTNRQSQVALAVARGLSNAEIARELGLALATVKDHVHAILTRLNLSRRSEIAAACHGVELTGNTGDR